jgi:hypothetical protein
LEYTIEYKANRTSENIIMPLIQSIWRAELCRNFVKGFVKNPSDVDECGSNVQSFNTKIWNKGVYIVQIMTNDSKIMMKIIVIE